MVVLCPTAGLDNIPINVIIWTQCVIFRNMCVCVYIYAINNNCMNWKESERGYWMVWREERKGENILIKLKSQKINRKEAKRPL